MEDQLTGKHVMGPMFMFMGITVTIAFLLVITYLPLAYLLVALGICLLMTVGGYRIYRRTKYPKGFWEFRKFWLRQRVHSFSFWMRILIGVALYAGVLLITAFKYQEDYMEAVLLTTGLLNAAFITLMISLFKTEPDTYEMKKFKKKVVPGERKSQK
ncbi:TPA: hypothetical protein HA265_04540 [Candidatus Woesearchaeota archaeon]|nr:hypothetical protein [Candidatus Woesearchaeota archaeon]